MNVCKHYPRKKKSASKEQHLKYQRRKKKQSDQFALNTQQKTKTDMFLCYEYSITINIIAVQQAPYKRKQTPGTNFSSDQILDGADFSQVSVFKIYQEKCK